MPWPACAFKLASDGRDVADPSRSMIGGSLHRKRAFSRHVSQADNRRLRSDLNRHGWKFPLASRGIITDADQEPMTGLGGLLQVRGGRETLLRAILLSALALGAMTAVATADPAVPTLAPAKPAVASAAPTGQKGPIELSDAQADKITAGSPGRLGQGLNTAGDNVWNSGLQKAHDSAPGSAAYGQITASLSKK
jgi:hypothetical protein